MAGTLAYFAPEMVPQKSKPEPDPEPEKENAKVDIYALGVAVYLLLTGRFTMGKFMQTLRRHDQQMFYVWRHPLLTNPDTKSVVFIRRYRKYAQ